MPAEFKAKMTSLEEVGRLRQALFSLSDAKGRLISVLATISQCQEAIKSKKDRFLAEFTEYVDKEIEELEGLKTVLSAEIEKAVDRTRDQLLQPSVTGTDLTVLLWKAIKGQAMGNFDLFSYDFRGNQGLDMEKLVGLSWESRVDMSGKLGDSHLIRNNYCKRRIITQELLQNEYVTKESLLSTAKTAYNDLLPDPFVLETTLQDLIFRYYEGEYTCLQAKDDLLSLDIDPELSLDQWISNTIAGFRQRTNGVSEGVVSRYVEGVKMAAERKYVREVGSGRQEHRADLGSGSETDRLTALERLVTDLATRPPPPLLSPLEKRIEDLEARYLAADEQMKEVMLNKQLGNVRKLIDDVRESSRSGLIRVENGCNERFETGFMQFEEEKRKLVTDLMEKITANEEKQQKSRN